MKHAIGHKQTTKMFLIIKNLFLHSSKFQVEQILKHSLKPNSAKVSIQIAKHKSYELRKKIPDENVRENSRQMLARRDGLLRLNYMFTRRCLHA